MAAMLNDVEQTAQQFLTPIDAARILGRQPQWVREQCKLNNIPHRKLGGRYVLTREDLDAYLTAAHRPAATS